LQGGLLQFLFFLISVVVSCVYSHTLGVAHHVCLSKLFGGLKIVPTAVNANVDALISSPSMKFTEWCALSYNLNKVKQLSIWATCCYAYYEEGQVGNALLRRTLSSICTIWVVVSHSVL
jgi:hypothetical protein